MGVSLDDVSVVYVESAEDAIVVCALDAAAGRVRLIIPVLNKELWGEHYSAIARGRKALVATPDDHPGNLAAERWGADLWRAGARDVGRLRPPPGTSTWAAAWAAALRDEQAKREPTARNARL